MSEDKVYDYDIAVSFAGEDRVLVRAIVDGLKAHDVKVFFDEDSTAEMWGENLLDFSQAVYTHRARYAVVFVSRHYVAKKWTTYERQAAQDRAFQQTVPYLLPVRIDDAELPGLPSTIGYLDAEFAGVEGIVEAVLQKLGHRSQAHAPKFDGRVPRTSEAIAVVLSERPPGWEFLLYGGMLHQGVIALEDRFRDHVIEYAPHNGTVIASSDGLSWLAAKLVSIDTIVSNLGRVLADDAQTAAFGPPGEPGDPQRIIHLAERFTGIYGEILDWSASLRATGFDARTLRHAADIEARFADGPIRRIRAFVEEYLKAVDEISTPVLEGQSPHLTLHLKIDIDPALLADYDRAVAAHAAALAEGS